MKKKVILVLSLLLLIAVGGSQISCGGANLQVCTVNQDCPQGQYCTSYGTCAGSISCSSNANCNQGEVCASDGFCAVSN